jgi:hypothetical protein
MKIQKLLLLTLLSASMAHARPLGTFTLGNEVPGPTGYSTHNFKITNCYGLGDSPGNGQIAVKLPIGTPVSYDVFFSGAGGGQFWTSIETVNTPQMFNKLVSRGHAVIQIRWLGNGWFGAPDGSRYGLELQAARPATVIAYVWTNIAHSGRMQVVGESAGSAAIGYALSSYNQWATIDVAILISGPPLAHICQGCTEQTGYGYNDPSAESLVDMAWGYYNKTGPCIAHDASFCGLWNSNSVETGGTNYYYPNTFVKFIEGGRDSYNQIKHREEDFYAQLVHNGQTLVSFSTVPAMAHNIQQSTDGMAVLFNLLTQ